VSKPLPAVAYISQNSLSDALVDPMDHCRMIGIAEVRHLMAGMSVRQIDRLIDAGRFPAPTFLSPNRRAWRFRTIVEFLNQLESAGRSKRACPTRKYLPAQDATTTVSAGCNARANAPHFTDDEIPY
jgi:predicted DNA-binding transcriptional regulator AlpA